MNKRLKVIGSLLDRLEEARQEKELPAGSTVNLWLTDVTGDDELFSIQVFVQMEPPNTRCQMIVDVDDKKRRVFLNGVIESPNGDGREFTFCRHKEPATQQSKIAALVVFHLTSMINEHLWTLEREGIWKDLTADYRDAQQAQQEGYLQ